MDTSTIDNLTVKELKDELRKYNGANLGGNKTQLQNRLKEYRQVAAQAAQTALEDAGVFDDAPTPGGVSPLAKGTGVGSRRSSPEKDTTAPLEKGEALHFVLRPRPIRFHEITIKCMSLLRVATLLMTSTADPDPRIEVQLNPLYELCNILRQHARSMHVEPSYATNMVRLSNAVTTDLYKIALMDGYDHTNLEPCVRQVFEAFGGVPGEAKGEEGERQISGSKSPGGGREEPEEEDSNVQKAIEESLKDLDDQQQQMQKYYAAQLRLARGEGTVEEAEEQIGEEIQETTTAMEGLETVGTSTQGGDELPDDDEIRQAVAKVGAGGMSFLDLIKLGNVRKLGEERAKIFVKNLVQRGVIKDAPGGRFVLGSGTGAAIIAGAPTLLPSPARPGTHASHPSHPSTSSNIPGLVREVLQIQDAIHSFLCDWTDDFPEPTTGEWPRDFDTKERAAMRKFITSSLQSSDLLDGEDKDGEKQERLVNNILEEEDFPVAKGKNEAAVRAVIKERLYDLHGRKERATDKSRSKFGSTKDDAGIGETNDDGDDDGEGAGDEDEGEAMQLESQRTTTAGKRGREEEGEGEAASDERQRKKARGEDSPEGEESGEGEDDDEEEEEE